ncbi:MAG: DUF4868 domain-containing protein [Gammaproteobacteria bacterium]|nr:DUF4868 domain-containing protein [Gammaproteobacteria bacterium]
MHISQRVDFIVADDTIFVLNKAKFESVLSYKQAHQEDFEGLLAENEFVDVFSKTDALVSYVGENKIQLRRASAIRHKGHYKDPGFMENLRRHHANYQLNIDFDEEGRIIATPSACKDIFQALLDHLLASGFSRNVYDVPDVKRVRR